VEADDAFDEQEFYDHVKRAMAHWQGSDRTIISRKNHAVTAKELLRWMDKSGIDSESTNKLSPGEKAAVGAATADKEADTKGRLRIVDDKPREDFQGRPAADQPKSFEEAAEKANEQFMTAVTGGKDE